MLCVCIYSIMFNQSMLSKCFLFNVAKGKLRKIAWLMYEHIKSNPALLANFAEE